MPIKFENPRFVQVSSYFSCKQPPTSISHPYFISASTDCATMLGLGALNFESEEALRLFSGSFSENEYPSFATVYSGHQFGVWAGQLGDGRALLLGEIQTQQDIYELQLKGAGVTPFSRHADGRAVLRSSIREFLCSEAMHFLNIPTTRALCLYGSKQRVWRETPETTAILTRVAPSFIRFGHFEHWASIEKQEELRKLIDFVVSQYFPAQLNAQNRALALLEQVIALTANLIAKWQLVGFMHGVMNTDNMSIIGLTLDYGPFGFMDAYDPHHICNHSDQGGRYAFDKQPNIGWWNCYALAMALREQINNDHDLQNALDQYPILFEQAYSNGLTKKLGFSSTKTEYVELATSLLDMMESNQSDFTNTFRKLAYLEDSFSEHDENFAAEFNHADEVYTWLTSYRALASEQHINQIDRQNLMKSHNPKLVLRNHLAAHAIQCAERGDFSEVQNLLRALENPFADHPAYAHYAEKAPEWAKSICVSCSS